MPISSAHYFVSKLSSRCALCVFSATIRASSHVDMMQPPMAMCTTLHTHTLIERVQWSELGLFGSHTEHTHTHMMIIIILLPSCALSAQRGSMHSAEQWRCTPPSMYIYINYGVRTAFCSIFIGSVQPKNSPIICIQLPRLYLNCGLSFQIFEHIYYGPRVKSRLSFYLRCIPWTLEQ